MKITLYLYRKKILYQNLEEKATQIIAYFHLDN